MELLLGAATGVLLTIAVGRTTLPVVPKTTCPGADVNEIDADAGLARRVFIGLILPAKIIEVQDNTIHTS